MTGAPFGTVGLIVWYLIMRTAGAESMTPSVAFRRLTGELVESTSDAPVASSDSEAGQRPTERLGVDPLPSRLRGHDQGGKPTEEPDN